MSLGFKSLMNLPLPFTYVAVAARDGAGVQQVAGSSNFVARPGGLAEHHNSCCVVWHADIHTGYRDQQTPNV